MKPNEVGSAFPHPEVARVQDGRCVVANADTGMTLRDWFAGQALAGICASIDHGDLDGYYRHKAGSRGDSNIPYPSSIAEHAHAIADAMLKAREAKP